MVTAIQSYFDYNIWWITMVEKADVNHNSMEPFSCQGAHVHVLAHV